VRLYGWGMGDDPFASPRRKIARAKEHLGNLTREIRAFIDSGAYVQIVEDDSTRPGYTLHKIKLTQKIPQSIEDTAGDAITNLRSALDHACFGVAVASGNSNPQNAYFPFARDIERLEAAIKGRCKDVPKEIYPLFRSLKPYAGGNELLWDLNLLCTADKHKIITPMGTGFVTPAINLKGTGFFELPTPPVWNHAKQEMVIITLGPGAKYDYHLQFILFIAFDNVGSASGKAVRGLLWQMLVHVGGIVAAIEAESKRLGFIKQSP
jgi:hypothetical protein